MKAFSFPLKRVSFILLTGLILVLIALILNPVFGLARTLPHKYSAVNEANSPFKLKEIVSADGTMQFDPNGNPIPQDQRIDFSKLSNADQMKFQFGFSYNAFSSPAVNLVFVPNPQYKGPIRFDQCEIWTGSSHLPGAHLPMAWTGPQDRYPYQKIYGTGFPISEGQNQYLIGYWTNDVHQERNNTVRIRYGVRSRAVGGYNFPTGNVTGNIISVKKIRKFSNVNYQWNLRFGTATRNAHTANFEVKLVPPDDNKSYEIFAIDQKGRTLIPEAEFLSVKTPDQYAVCFANPDFMKQSKPPEIKKLIVFECKEMTVRFPNVKLNQPGWKQQAFAFFRSKYDPARSKLKLSK